MGLTENTAAIYGAFSDIKDAIEDKGVTVAANTPVTEYANLIGDISGGAGTLDVSYDCSAQFDGRLNSFPKLPFTVNADHMITVDFTVTQATNGMCIFGNTGSKNYPSLAWWNNSDYPIAWYCGTGNAETYFNEDISPLGHHIFICNKNGGNYYDGVRVSGYTPVTNANATLQLAVCLDYRNDVHMKLHSFKIESISTGEVLCWLRPWMMVDVNSNILIKGFSDVITGNVYEGNYMTVVKNNS